MNNGSFMKVESIAECSPWSILQYFWAALSDNKYWKPMFAICFEWPLKTGFTVPSTLINWGQILLFDCTSILIYEEYV